jgi:signal peptidase II
VARHRLLAVGVVLGVVVLDQLSKEWALGALDDGRVIEVLPTLQLDLTLNEGFSFGSASGHGRLVGVLVGALIVGLVWLLARERRPRRVVLLAMILGGALGNFLDRVARADDGMLSGAVVDFIDVTWYAVFNVADAFVVVGGILLAFDELRHARLQSDRARAGQS